MEILLITSTDNLLGVAGKLAEEGHTVKLWGDSEGNGFVEKVRFPYEALKTCKFIISDGIAQREWDWAKTFNKPVIGSHPLVTILNNDCFREYQMAVKLGVEIPETEVINDIGDMYTKVLEWNSARTLIRYDRETISCDHQRWLAWAMHKLPLNKRILLQRPTWGEELQVTGWFDGSKWARPFILKTSNEIQIRTSSLLALFSRDWARKTIGPWEEFLRAIEYKGPFKVRLYATKNKLQLIDTYAGFEFPSLYAFLEGNREPVGDFLNRIAFNVCDEIDITTDYVSCASVGSTLKEPEGAPVLGLDEGNRKHLYWGAVDCAQDEIVIKRAQSWIYTVAARGRSLEESFGRMYFTHSQVHIPEPNIMTSVRPAHEQWFTKVRDLGYL